MGEPLKPCPFCGADIEVTYQPKSKMFGPHGNHRPACIFSSWDLHEWSSRQDAISAWNARAPDPRIAKLEGLVNDLSVVLEACRAQFQFYADEHTKAGKLEKAKTNQSCADECADFLARIKQELPE